MTQPEIEPWSPRPLADTLIIRPTSGKVLHKEPCLGLVISFPVMITIMLSVPPHFNNLITVKEEKVVGNEKKIEFKFREIFILFDIPTIKQTLKKKMFGKK